ncbi:ribokinase [Desulfovibrio inopinatus]|uniref:ribokinase n=1 Tax=Desulfovibrio inopinatus TaxID=102109 RepID=UPI000416909C|nr:ribokinase [Desulfovibrio inopinatus]
MAILNFGSLNIDHVYSFTRFVRPGETISCTDYQRFAGGKGLNQSVALAAADATVFHAGKVGPDGEQLLAVLKEHGVDSRFVAVDTIPSGHAIIQVDAEGENSIFLYPGANHAIHHDEVSSVLKHFDKDDIVLLQNEVNATDYIIREAAAKGMTIVFNPAPMTPEVLSYPLECIDCFILNETEAQGMSGGIHSDNILEDLHARFPHATIVLTLGKRGVVIAEGSEVIEVPAFPVQAVDTTAAGDTFVGYFLAEKSHGRSTTSALQIGCAASALCVGKTGAVPSIPQRADVEAFLRLHGTMLPCE